MAPSMKLNTTDYFKTLANAETFDDLEALLAIVDDAYDRGAMTANAVTTLGPIDPRTSSADRKKQNRPRAQATSVGMRRIQMRFANHFTRAEPIAL